MRYLLSLLIGLLLLTDNVSAHVGLKLIETEKGIIWLWYPAKKSSDKPLKYGDMIALSDSSKWYTEEPLKF